MFPLRSLWLELRTEYISIERYCGNNVSLLFVIGPYAEDAEDKLDSPS